MNYKGLSTHQVQQLKSEYGLNILPRGQSVSLLKILLRQFASPLVFVLFFAAGVTIFLNSYSDTIVILLAMVVNTFLGFYQEAKAEHTLSALQGMLGINCQVIRSGRREQILATELVPGDIVILSSGDHVPADGKLLETHSLSINEAILTGESLGVLKKVNPKTAPLGLVYMGTTVISGTGIFIVKKTGGATQMGKIAKELLTVVQSPTPLQKRVTRLSFYLTIMVAVVSGLVFVIGIALGNNVSEMFTTTVALSVSMIPEGMLVSLTVILAMGMQRILKQKALVRRLVAAETLGTVTVIATDKTGTLTEGIMKVKKVQFVNKSQALLACVYANELDDPIETAIWEWAAEQGVDAQKLIEKNPRQSIKPFDSRHMYMSVKVDGEVYTKGAPEVVIGLCQLTKAEKNHWLKMADEWSREGLRLLGLSQDSKWLGLIAVEDPVRPDIKAVFAKAKRAGIRVIMVTGDYVGTAEAVWKQISSIKPIVVDGLELKKMDPADLTQIVSRADIFARVTPEDKLKIVEALSASGEVVAIIGDGVNDAPALKAADIGIVVGGASDVAVETADMVLLDSNFKTVILAIEEGRGMFETIKKVILYLLSNSFSEVTLLVLCLLSGLPLALSAAQILWINLITDGLPNVALTFEPHDKGLLMRQPISISAPIIDFSAKILITIVSLSTGIVSFAFFAYFQNIFGFTLARSTAFAIIGFSTLLSVYSIRTKGPLWKINQFKNPYLIFAVMIGMLLQIAAFYQPTLSSFLHTTALAREQWFAVIVASIFILFLIESMKLFLYSVFTPEKSSPLFYV